jgi:hypothetical protein
MRADTAEQAKEWVDSLEATSKICHDTYERGSALNNVLCKIQVRDFSHGREALVGACVCLGERTGAAHLAS